MLRKFSLRGRFILLILVSTLMLLIVGSAAWWNASVFGQDMTALRSYNERQQPLRQLAGLIEDELGSTVNAVALGMLGWELAREQLTELHDRFEALWQRHLDSLSAAERTRVDYLHQGTLDSLRHGFSELSRLVDARDRVQLRLFAINDFDALILPYLETVQARIGQLHFTAMQHYRAAHTAAQQRIWVVFGLVALGLGLVLVIGLMVQRSIMQPIGRIATVAKAVTVGNYSVRVGFSGRDELGKLGQALDRLLDDHHDSRTESEQDNLQLKTALEQLQQNLQQLGQGDLRARLPTDEDATATLAAPINQLTERAVTTLQQIHQLSERIDGQIQQLRTDANALTESTRSGLGEVATLSELSGTLDAALKELDEIARAGDQAAGQALQSSQRALEATRTQGDDDTPDPQDRINALRQRLTQLQTCSADIALVVEDFSAAAKQARILGINAGLRANADDNDHPETIDLKGLARSLARSEQLMGKLGQRLQSETGKLLDTLPSSESRDRDSHVPLAETSAQLQTAHQATAELASAVQHIAADLQARTRTSGQLLVSSTQLHASTEESLQQLQNQLTRIDALTEHARSLQQVLQAFRLPSERTESEPLPLKPT